MFSAAKALSLIWELSVFPIIVPIESRMAWKGTKMEELGKSDPVMGYLESIVQVIERRMG